MPEKKRDNADELDGAYFKGHVLPHGPKDKRSASNSSFAHDGGYDGTYQSSEHSNVEPPHITELKKRFMPADHVVESGVLTEDEEKRLFAFLEKVKKAFFNRKLCIARLKSPEKVFDVRINKYIPEHVGIIEFIICPECSEKILVCFPLQKEGENLVGKVISVEKHKCVKR